VGVESNRVGLSGGVKFAVVASVIALIAVVFALRAVPRAERPSIAHVVTYVVTVPASPTPTT
jgi:hypothetical protein